jgi:hypothetical protein
MVATSARVDIEQTSEADQPAGAQFDHRELGAIGPDPRILLECLLPHFESLRVTGSAQPRRELQVLIPAGDGRHVLCLHER